MKLYNCVMLSLSNPGLLQVNQELLNNFSQYINIDYITSECKSWKSLVESEPHVTLIYGLTPGLGKNKLYNEVKLKNRDEYLAIKNCGELTLDNPVIDYFDDEGARVLKINFKGCNQYNQLKGMMTKLCEIPNDWKYKEDYSPHLTLTYLKPDAPDETARVLMDKYSKMLHNFKINGYIISSNDNNIPNERFE